MSQDLTSFHRSREFSSGPCPTAHSSQDGVGVHAQRSTPESQPAELWASISSLVPKVATVFIQGTSSEHSFKYLQRSWLYVWLPSLTRFPPPVLYHLLVAVPRKYLRQGRGDLPPEPSQGYLETQWTQRSRDEAMLDFAPGSGSWVPWAQSLDPGRLGSTLSLRQWTQPRRGVVSSQVKRAQFCVPCGW